MHLHQARSRIVMYNLDVIRLSGEQTIFSTLQPKPYGTL